MKLKVIKRDLITDVFYIDNVDLWTDYLPISKMKDLNGFRYVKFARTGGYLYERDPKFSFFILEAALLQCLFITYKFIREPEKTAI